MRLSRTSDFIGRSLSKRDWNKKQSTKILTNEGKVVADHINSSIHSTVGKISTPFHTYDPKAVIADWQKSWTGVINAIGKLTHFIQFKAKAKISTFILGLILLLTFSSSISTQGLVASSKYNPAVTSSVGVTEIKAEVTFKEGPAFQWPVSGETSQEYHFYHPGIDIPNPVGSEIKPVASGIVEKATRDYDGRGINVVIAHKDGFSSNYFHLEKTNVSIGQEIDENTSIGTVGLTGRTTGAHLHFELLEDGKTVNPRKYLP